MDTRNITFEEFNRMPEKEKADAYCKLTDADKFRVRISMNPGAISVPCNECVHYLGYAKCKAFPHGISGEHMDMLIENINVPCADSFHFTK